MNHLNLTREFQHLTGAAARTVFMMVSRRAGTQAFAQGGKDHLGHQFV